jgi:tRNA A37 threonylcarbamoyladenosine synthetase subunit TsaC/SUA5/YrdC
MIAFDKAGWAQAGLAGLIAALGTTFWAGQANTSLAEARSQVQQVKDQQQADHDKLISHDTTLKDIQSDVSEIKQDVKTLLRK